MMASVGVHAMVATTLLVAPARVDPQTLGANELELVEFEPQAPPPEPEPTPEPLIAAEAAPTVPVASRDRGLRVRAPAAPGRLALGRIEGRRGPFDFRERLDVGRYTPRLAVPTTAIPSPRRTASVPAAPDAREDAPSTEGTQGARPEAVPTEPNEAEATATTAAADTTAATRAAEPPIELEPVTPEAPAPEPTVTAEESRATSIVATSHTDLAALHTLGHGAAVSRCLGGLGFDPLPLLGLETTEVLASADVRGAESSGVRALALVTRLDAAALRQRIEGAAIARGAAPVFGETPLPSSATITVSDRSYTLTLDGPKLVLASRPSARLLRDGLEGLSFPTRDAIAVAERIAPATEEGPLPTRLLASVHATREDTSPARLRLVFEFGSEAEAETAPSLGVAWLDVARRALGLPESAITTTGEPAAEGSSLVIEASVERMGASELAVHLGRAD